MEALIKQRTSYKSTLTRIENFINKNKDKNLPISEYVTRQTRLSEVFVAFSNIQDEIELLDNSDAQLQERESVEDRFYTVLSRLLDIIETSPSHSQHKSQTPPAQAISQNIPAVKLPDIDIPPFAGNPSEWVSFYELFTTLIINNSQITNIQRFMYLKGYLRHEPLRLISNLQLTNDNFDIAINILSKRYSNKLLQVNTHINSLFEIPVVTKCNANNLREFLTQAKQNIESLDNLLTKEMQSDLIILHLLEQKLDFNTRKGFEMNRDSTQLPTLDAFLDFLNKKCVSLEILNPGQQVSHNRQRGSFPSNSQSRSHFSAHSQTHTSQPQTNFNCSYCRLNGHKIYTCDKFSKLSYPEKSKFVFDNKMCRNCLGSKHALETCLSKGCYVCSGRHHSLLHIDSRNSAQNSNRTNYNSRYNDPNRSTNSGRQNGPGNSNNSQIFQNSNYNSSQSAVGTTIPSLLTAYSTSGDVLLATAEVTLYDINNQPIKAKALLDSGSQSSIITENLVRKLKYKTFNKNLQISGISQRCTTSNKMVCFNIFSNINPQQNFQISCAVLDNITCKLPQVQIDTDKLRIPQDIQLADSTFFIPSTIDILIGADVYYSLLCDGLIKLENNPLVLQNTHLGWLIAGSIPHQGSLTSLNNLCTSSTTNVSLFLQTENKLESIDHALTKFWTIEEIPCKPVLTPEDELAENIFLRTTKVLENGTYQVNIPLITENENSKLGESLQIAQKRFLHLEKRFQKDPQLFSEYKAFIDNYVDSGYGRYIPITLRNKNNENKYYLPHHCVVKEGGSTKLRVVYDASCKSSRGVSLNDISLKGFPVQPDLYDILNRFRVSKFVMTSDIEKMYLQIKINPEQTFLQNILWREAPNDEFKCIELVTVIFGTNFAPYVATRVLNDIALKNESDFPLASKALLNSTYVDDILCSCDSYEELVETHRQLKTVLNSAGFKLHKFCSNSEDFLKVVDNDKQSTIYNIKSENATNKVLGIAWNPNSDHFSVTIPKLSESHTKCTKREVLSKLSQMYDPLGLINPIIVTGKCLMQKIWLSRIEWDDPLPHELYVEWQDLINNISYLSQLKIPRHLFTNKEIHKLELHGFADASIKAYGACLYIRAIYSDLSVSTYLIITKCLVKLRTQDGEFTRSIAKVCPLPQYDSPDL